VGTREYAVSYKPNTPIPEALAGIDRTIAQLMGKPVRRVAGAQTADISIEVRGDTISVYSHVLAGPLVDETLGPTDLTAIYRALAEPPLMLAHIYNDSVYDAGFALFRNGHLVRRLYHRGHNRPPRWWCRRGPELIDEGTRQHFEGPPQADETPDALAARVLRAAMESELGYCTWWDWQRPDLALSFKTSEVDPPLLFIAPERDRDLYLAQLHANTDAPSPGPAGLLSINRVTTEPVVGGDAKAPALDFRAKPLALLPDGRIASAKPDGSVALLDPVSGRELYRFPAGHRRVLRRGRQTIEAATAVHQLFATVDGQLVSTNGSDETAHIFDVRDTTRSDPPQRRVIHTSGMFRNLLPRRATLPFVVRRRLPICTLLNVVSGNRLIVAETTFGRRITGALRLRRTPQGFWPQRSTVFPYSVADSFTTVVELPDGRLVSTGEDGLSLSVWDLAPLKEIARIENTGTLGPGNPNPPVAALPDGRIALGGSDGSIEIWDITTGTAQFSIGHAFIDPRIPTTARSGQRVRAFAALPTGRLLSAGADQTVRLWQFERGKEPAELARIQLPGAVKTSHILQLLVLADGQAVLAATMSGAIYWIALP
jgi:WD domain, G-beta repeat